jgi:hypothetical protein
LNQGKTVFNSGIFHHEDHEGSEDKKYYKGQVPAALVINQHAKGVP